MRYNCAKNSTDKTQSINHTGKKLWFIIKPVEKIFHNNSSFIKKMNICPPVKARNIQLPLLLQLSILYTILQKKQICPEKLSYAFYKNFTRRRFLKNQNLKKNRVDIPYAIIYNTKGGQLWNKTKKLAK